MLEEHSERISTFFIADYEPQLEFATKLSAAADAVQARFAAPNWAFDKELQFCPCENPRFIGWVKTLRNPTGRTGGLRKAFTYR